MFVENLRNNDSHYFWNQVNKYSNQISIFLGTIKINTKIEDYSEFISTILEDVENKMANKGVSNDFYLKLLYDIDNSSQPVLHYLLVINRDRLPNFNRTLLYGISTLNNIDQRLVNFRKQIDHYLEYHDAYGYRRINTFTAGGKKTSKETKDPKRPSVIKGPRKRLSCRAI